MTRPGPRPSAVPASIAGAVDLSVLKDRPAPPPSAGGGDDATGLAPIVDVTAATFEAEVLQRSTQVPVVVDLGSARSPQSAALTRQLGQLAVEAAGAWVLARVDVDASPQIAQAFGVQAIPTVVAVAAGQPLADFQGTQPDEQLRTWLNAVLDATAGKLSGAPSELGNDEEQEVEDPRFTAAEQALEDGDFAAAESAYQLIVDEEPGNTEASAAIKQVRFLARTQDLAPDAVAISDAEPSNVSARVDAADAELADQNPQAAFTRLIEGIKISAGDERTELRTRLLQLFELFDAADPIVIAARRKLAAALY